MALFTHQKSEIVQKFRRSELDTGSSEVQIALLTARIRDMTQHFQEHAKDHQGRTGLIRLVNRRKKLLGYLRKTEPERYTQLIADLGLRK